MKTPHEMLSEIESRANEATPGPWTREKPGRDESGFQKGLPIAATYGHQIIYSNSDGGQFPSADADFIAAARTDVPRLVAALRVAYDALDLVSEDAFDNGGNRTVTKALEDISAILTKP